MSYTSILSRNALAELSDAWRWYEDRQEGLGDRFKDAVYKSIAQIEESPTKGIKRKDPYREAIVRIFPFLIIYRIETKTKQIFVHSIFHTRRNPREKYSSPIS